MSDGVLTPKQLEERGLGHMFGPPDPAMEGSDMAILGENFRMSGPGGEYVPENDVLETLPDGRVIQVAVKGVPVSMAYAVQHGMVKETKQAGPSETKPKAPPTNTKNKPEDGK